MPPVSTESPVTWPNVCFHIRLTSHTSASGGYENFWLFNPHGNQNVQLNVGTTLNSNQEISTEQTCQTSKSTEIMVLEYGLSTDGVSVLRSLCFIRDLIIKMQIDVDVTANTALKTSIRSWLGNRICDHSKRQEFSHALFYDVGKEEFLDQIFYHREPISIQSRHQQTVG